MLCTMHIEVAALLEHINEHLKISLALLDCVFLLALGQTKRSGEQPISYKSPHFRGRLIDC